MTTGSTLLPGFKDSVHDAQGAFRAAMSAMARPGTIHQIKGLPSAPPPLSPACAALALTLFDHDTLVWLDAKLAAAGDVAFWLRFHTGVRLVPDPSSAAFALVSQGAHLPALNTFSIGTLEYPDRSTTILVEVERLETEMGWHLTGPGVKGVARFSAGPLPMSFLAAWADNRALFPRGVDMFLTAGDRIAALPRTTVLAS